MGIQSKRVYTSALLWSLLWSLFGALTFGPCASHASSRADDDCHDTYAGTRDEAELRERVCELVNIERRKRGRKPVSLDARLSAVADRHASDMVDRRFFAHITPEGRGLVWRLETGRVEYRMAGENIAMGPHVPERVVRNWMNSPGHRRNLLKSSYRKLGVGHDETHWVQVFTD